jgi:hypothetical protein
MIGWFVFLKKIAGKWNPETTAASADFAKNVFEYFA